MSPVTALPRRPRTARSIVRPAVPVALLAAAAGSLAVPTAASAATGTVTVNAGYTLVARSTPSDDGAAVRQLKNGAKVTIVCQIDGQRVTGRFGTSKLWDRLEGGGYVSDTYLYTGSDGRVAPTCAAPAPATPAPTTPATPVADPATGAGTGAEGGGAAGTAGGGKRVAKVTLKNDYPYPRASPDRVDPWNFFFRECTSFVAYRLSRNIPGFANGWGGKGSFGNAIDWDDKARRLGYVVDRRPTDGSVMVRNFRSNGHVAVVAKVGTGRRKGQFLVEQYNAGGGHGYSQAWIRNAKGLLFIHFDRKA